jgi:TetR/AcrR family transcriptional regulator
MALVTPRKPRKPMAPPGIAQAASHDAAPERIRDAQRSRQALLQAATVLFAERGYDGVSMSDIGQAAGLSRGAPGYFFGSKEQLYGAVLALAFEGRQASTERAFASIREWCESDAGLELLRAALLTAAAGYMRFLAEHPAFVALIMREELDGGRRLPGRSRSSTAMQDAFAALTRAGAGRGLGWFRVGEAVLLFVSLTFAPFSYRNTLLRSVGLDVVDERGLRRQAKLAADQLMHFLTP